MKECSGFYFVCLFVCCCCFLVWSLMPISYLVSRRVIYRRKSFDKGYFSEKFGDHIQGGGGISSAAVAKVVWIQIADKRVNPN